MKNTEFPIQMQRLSQIVSHPSLSKCVVDMGGPGKQLAEDLQAQYGKVVEPYAVTGPRKAALYEQVKRFVQYELVSLPNSQQVREDILAMARTATVKGNISYDGHTAGTHCDYFCALALALHAAQSQGQLSMATNKYAEAV